MSGVIKSCIFRYSLFLAFIISSNILQAQTITPRVAEPPIKKPDFDSLINLYGAKQHSPALFIHFDKNVYANNENVWFTGYVLGNFDASRYKTLSLALVKDDDNSILMDDRFVVTNGFCFGNANIPDSVRAGAYTFVAYGNRVENNLPDIVFKQQVSIKSGGQQTFIASLNPLDTAATAANQKVMLLVNFINVKSQPSSVPVTYYVGNARKPVTAGAVKTAAGQYIFNIPSNLLNAANNQLHVQVKYKTEVQDITMALPVLQQPAQVRFYPEGGNIVNGFVNMIGWEAKNAEGAPLNAEAVLYEGERAIDTINTNGNGMGRFFMLPRHDKKYTVKLVAANGDKIYNLPDATSGARLSVARAIVNDTLVADVYNDDPLRKLYLIGHNYRQAFFETPVTHYPSQRIKIILNGIPRGLMQLTLVDSLGRPFAERAVFAHYTNKTKLNISLDNDSYGNRKKVKLNIKLNGEAANAAVSVAVVQENRVEIKNKNDIENYIYLKRELGDIPVKENYFSNDDFDKRDLENALLIRGWSRYKWTDVLKVQAQDTVKIVNQLAFSGKVSRRYGKFKKTVTVLAIDPTSTYETDIAGNFALPDSAIITPPGKQISFMVAGGDPADFNINILNPYDSLNKYIAATIQPVIYYSAAQESSASMQVPGNERAIRLKEVVIKDRKDNTFYGNPQNRENEVKINMCGTYVCLNGIVNCPNHVPPGCLVTFVAPLKVKPNNVQLKGIYAAQEFYPADYSEVNPSQPEYMSTLYWKSQLMLKKDETQEVSFYTSDISGTYKVIVQGITDKDIIYGEATFRVTK